MTFTAADIVDSLAVDLVTAATSAAAALTSVQRATSPHGYLDWRYLSPVLLTQENAPWLAIWVPYERQELAGTTTGVGDYFDEMDVAIEWAVGLGDTMEDGGSQAPATVKAALLSADPIKQHLKTYASGLPSPYGNQVLGTIKQTDRDNERGFVYCQTWTLVVSSTGAE